MMNGDQIEVFEWVKLGLSGACAGYCLIGALYVVPQLSQNAFNGIWRTRLLVQITAFLLSVAQMLPLQLWDGEYGALNILPVSFNREILCKTFTVAALGVLQPFLLLLAGFLCSHALRDTSTHFSFRQFPILTAALVTLPFAAGQVLSAFWSTWLESTMDENDEIGRLPFSTFSRVPCPGEEGLHSYSDVPEPQHSAQLFTNSSSVSTDALAPEANLGMLNPAVSTSPVPTPAQSPAEVLDSTLSVPMSSVPIAPPLLCISCKYTFCSVVVHIVLTLLFAVIIATFGRVMLERCGNKALRHRIRLLCVLLPLLQALQCAAAAVTVVKRRPHTWTHEISKLVALVCVLALIVAVSTLLVFMPLQAAAYALRLVAKMRLDSEAVSASSGPLGSPQDDAVLLSAYHTKPGTPGHSAPLLGDQSVLSTTTTHPVAHDNGFSAVSMSHASRTSTSAAGSEPFTVDRRTQERAAAYAHDDGLGALRKNSSSRGGGGGAAW